MQFEDGNSLTEPNSSSLVHIYMVLRHLKYFSLFAEILNFYMNKQSISQTMLAKALNVDSNL